MLMFDAVLCVVHTIFLLVFVFGGTTFVAPGQLPSGLCVQCLSTLEHLWFLLYGL